MAGYVHYYKRFGKTYHVLLQLESIVLKSKGLPSVSPLVDANFTAEVETLVLTAGHDAQQLQGEISIDGARDGDKLTDRKSTRLNSSHLGISYAVFCLKKKKN